MEETRRALKQVEKDRITTGNKCDWDRVIEWLDSIFRECWKNVAVSWFSLHVGFAASRTARATEPSSTRRPCKTGRCVSRIHKA